MNVIELMPRASCSVILERIKDLDWILDTTDKYLIRTMLEKVEKEYARLDCEAMLENLTITVKCCGCDSVHNVQASELTWCGSKVKYYTGGETLKNTTSEIHCDCEKFFSFVIDIDSESGAAVKFSGTNCELVEV